MREPLVIAYVGDEARGLDIVSSLDQRLQRPARAVTIRLNRLRSVLADDRIDCVFCGPALTDGDIQQAVFDIIDTRDVPIFELTGDVAAVPDGVEIHHLDPTAPPQVNIQTLLGEVLDAETEQELTRGPYCYLAVDAEDTIIDWDPDLTDWTGWTPAEAVGASLWNVFPDWENSDLATECEQLREVGGETDLRVFHNETRKWLHTQVLSHGNGGLELYLLDVTEFQNAGGRIEGTGARFEETLDRITDAFFALDTEERFVFLNSQAEFLLDVDAKDVTGIRFWDAFPAAVSTEFYQEFNRAIETQEPTSFEEFYRPLDRWLEVNAYPSSEGLSVFLRDITEQVTLQENLEQLHDVTRELVVAESDREIAEQTVTATEEILDFPMVAVWRYEKSTDTLDPLAWSDKIDDRADEMEPLGRDSEFIWEVYESGEMRNMGFIPATTATSHHPGKVTSELLVCAGEYGVLGAYSDERDAFEETDIRLFKILSSTVESAFSRAERERQLARQNERLNDFASIVSHDLRNPLNVASSHLELARLSEDSTENLDKIEQSLFRMESLIEDILARARGDEEIEKEQLSLTQSAQQAWQNVDTETATLKLDGDAHFTADQDRIQQLFENLFATPSNMPGMMMA
ncbi:PAS domain-containing protein [Halovenus salina]|uniref:histidine kinase n=1 Tax=Halovenus salina TaxID=1510225 RepID=A0ABD5VV00_9EURY